MGSEHGDRIRAAAMFGVALTVYFPTSSAHLVGGDNAEFVTIFGWGGVAHPSGYPLYSILLRLLSWMPGGAVLGSSRVSAIISALGAEVVALPADRHDELVAVISHLPHLTAANLMVLASDALVDRTVLLRLAAGGFRDMTRIAAGQPGIWPDVCAENAPAMRELRNQSSRAILAPSRVKSLENSENPNLAARPTTIWESVTGPANRVCSAVRSRPTDAREKSHDARSRA